MKIIMDTEKRDIREVNQHGDKNRSKKELCDDAIRIMSVGLAAKIFFNGDSIEKQFLKVDSISTWIKTYLLEIEDRRKEGEFDEIFK